MGYIVIFLGLALIVGAHVVKRMMVGATSSPAAKPAWLVRFEAVISPVMTLTLGWVFGGGLIVAGFVLAIFR